MEAAVKGFRADGPTSVGAGIVTFDSYSSFFPGEPNKIVLITDGRNNFGGDPVGNAQKIRKREPSGRVSAIGIGNVDEEVLRDIVGSSGYVLSLENYVQLARVIDTVVCQVCALSRSPSLHRTISDMGTHRQGRCLARWTSQWPGCRAVARTTTATQPSKSWPCWWPGTAPPASTEGPSRTINDKMDASTGSIDWIFSTVPTEMFCSSSRLPHRQRRPRTPPRSAGAEAISG